MAHHQKPKLGQGDRVRVVRNGTIDLGDAEPFVDKVGVIEKSSQTLVCFEYVRIGDELISVHDHNLQPV